jgi:type II secretory pathway component PulF
LIALLHVGEQSGRLAQTCQNAHEYLKKREKGHKAFQKVLAYPILNFSFFIGALFSLSRGLLPAITDIPSENYAALSWSTRFLLTLTQWNISWIPYGCAAGALVLLVCSRPLLFPVLGSWIARKTYWSFFSGLVLLLKEDIPLTKSLALMDQSVRGRSALREPISKVLREIQEGRTLTQSIAHLPHFSPMYLQFLKAGEGTGQLVGSLDLMTDFIQEDIGRTLDRWFFWITPLSLVLMGICFWILIEGAITPLYESIDHGMKDDWI